MPDEVTHPIFVVMPFVRTPTRDKAALTSFFEVNIKEHIESETTLKYRYHVKRSADAFGITAEIVRDLLHADLVICDLSGIEANPNVMFELGVRLALTHKPVILLREEHAENRTLFDVSGYFTFLYNPLRYREVEDHLIRKIRAFEEGAERFRSPVLSALQYSPYILAQMRREEALNRISLLQRGVHRFAILFGSSVTMFLQTRKVAMEAGNALALVKFLEANTESLRSLDWDSFLAPKFNVPALDAFLIDSPARGLVPGRLLTRIELMLSEFRETVAFDRSWFQAAPSDVIAYLIHEALLLSQLIFHLSVYVGYSANRETALQEIKKLMQLSRLTLHKQAADIGVIEGPPIDGAFLDDPYGPPHDE